MHGQGSGRAGRLPRTQAHKDIPGRAHMGPHGSFPIDSTPFYPLTTLGPSEPWLTVFGVIKSGPHFFGTFFNSTKCCLQDVLVTHFQDFLVFGS